MFSRDDAANETLRYLQRASEECVGQARRPILIVEDNPIDQELIGLAFKRAATDNPVVTVTDGEEALSFLKGHDPVEKKQAANLPAVIILDLDMPGMDGFEFLRRLKGEPRLARIPVVVLTTSRFDQDVSQSYKLGASSCITKPGDFEQLVRIAREVDSYWCRTNQITGTE
jgi:CheY-like chemotaxis protein